LFSDSERVLLNDAVTSIVSAFEVTTLWRYTNLFIIIIISSSVRVATNGVLPSEGEFLG